MQFINYSISPRLCHRNGGFTAIELMVVIGILAVLAGLAGPSFTLMIESWRVRNATEALRSSLQIARSEAIKRGGMVAIQKLPNNINGCTTAASTTAVSYTHLTLPTILLV